MMQYIDKSMYEISITMNETQFTMTQKCTMSLCTQTYVCLFHSIKYMHVYKYANPDRHKYGCHIRQMDTFFIASTTSCIYMNCVCVLVMIIICAESFCLCTDILEERMLSNVYTNFVCLCICDVYTQN